MIELILTLIFVAYLGWAINHSLTIQEGWEDDFWKELIERDLDETTP